MRPALQSAAQAKDLVACAKVFLVMPGFRSPVRMWRPDTIQALADSIDQLEAEAAFLSAGRPS